MFTWQRKKIDFNYCMDLAIENYRVTSKNNAHSPDFVLVTIATDCTSIRCFSTAPDSAACVGLLHFSASVVVN